MVDLAPIREKIEKAVRAQWWSDQLPATIHGVVREIPGSQPWHGGELMFFVEEYVRSTPRLLEALARASAGAGLVAQVQPLLEAAVGYWEWDEDEIPDSLGLIGLADDAYLSLRLIERFVEEQKRQSGGRLWELDLSFPNRKMGALLGAQLAAKLNGAVESTLAQVELRQALRAVAGWNEALLIGGGPATPADLPENPLLEEVSQEASRRRDPSAQEPAPQADTSTTAAPFSRREIVWGNLSVLALGLAIALFSAWQIYFRYPAEATVSLFGWEIELAWLDRLRTFLLGSLGVSAIFAADNLKPLVAHFYWPFRHLQGPQIKRFLASPGTAIVSLAVLALFAVLSATNVSTKVVLGSEGETQEFRARLANSRDAFLFLPTSGEVMETRPLSEVRLSAKDPAPRIALRGFGARALLLVRDKYGLTTVDALQLERASWSVRVTPLRLIAPPPTALDSVELDEYRAPEDLGSGVRSYETSRWALILGGPVRWNRTIYQRVRDRSGALWGVPTGRRLALEPAKPGACPPTLGVPPVDEFLDELCKEREFVATWTALSTRQKDGASTAHLDLPTYRLEILFTDGRVETGDPGQLPVVTREAVRVVATHEANHEQSQSPGPEVVRGEGVASPGPT